MNGTKRLEWKEKKPSGFQHTHWKIVHNWHQSKKSTHVWQSHWMNIYIVLLFVHTMKTTSIFCFSILSINIKEKIILPINLEKMPKMFVENFRYFGRFPQISCQIWSPWIFILKWCKSGKKASKIWHESVQS